MPPRALALAVALLAAGCLAPETDGPPATTPAGASTTIATVAWTTTTPGAPPTATTRAPAGGIVVTVEASRATMRSGEPVDLTIAARNDGTATVWTSRGFSCGGTWDLVLRDAGGAPVRIDDRDSLGCPDGGPLQDALAPGETLTLVYAWDGKARPQLGQTADVPPGAYVAEATVAYAAREDAATRGDPLDARGAKVHLRVEPGGAS